MPATMQDIGERQMIDLKDDIGDLLETLPENTEITAILSAFGANIERVFNSVRSSNDKRKLFNWFIRALHDNIGQSIPAPDHVNGK